MPAPTALHDLLRLRRSVRTFDPDHVIDAGDLSVILEAARWAPSAGNSQPWSFLVGRRGDDSHERLVGRLSRGNRSWVPAAGAVLVTLHQVASGPEDDALTYSDYAAYDLGQAVAHLTVQSLDLGLAVHQFAGFDHEGVATDFGVPRHWQVTTAIAIGRPLPSTADDRARGRRPLADFVYAESFGRPASFL